MLRSSLCLGFNLRRHYSSVSKLPVVGYSLLSNKSLISIKGPDASKFLNGLVTSKLLPSFVKKNITTISTEVEDVSIHLDDFDTHSKNWGILKESIESKNQTITRNGIYSMFLNSKGRIVTDTFIYPFNYLYDLQTHEDSFPQYLVEVDKSYLKSTLMLLKIHKLKAKVEIKEFNDHKVWYAFNDSKQEDLYNLQKHYFDEESTLLKSPESSLTQSKEFLKDSTLWSCSLNTENITGFAFDDRCPDFGVRVITPSSVGDLSAILSTEYLPVDTPSLSTETIDLRRQIFGIPEAPKDLKANKLLPLEANLEYMGGVSFDKGCYVGQELTVRTYHTGIVRKRIVPIKLYLYDRDPNEVVLTDEDELTNFEPNTLNDLEIFPDSIEKPTRSTSSATTSSPFGSSSKSISPRRSTRRSSGTLLSNNGSNGLALIRLEDFANENTKFSIEIPRVGEGSKTLKVGVKAFIPYWWPNE